MKTWDLKQWLYTLENRHPVEIQLGLTRISEVAEHLNLLPLNTKVITVAGTNGKGSTVAALEMIYHQAGYKVGIYTSPHLLSFNERIRVNLQAIADEDLCAIFYKIETLRQVELTYFEMITLAALIYFKQQALDLVILEVGMGGRLDATNIVSPDLAIITTIDFDHETFLGDTLEKIGLEKAGILRPNIPFIYADINPPSTILELSKQLKTQNIFYAKNYTFLEENACWTLTYKDKTLAQLPKPKIQLKSAAAALLACQILKSMLPVKEETLRVALKAIFIPGRLELHTGPVHILYDVSHNPQSVRLLATFLKTIKKVKVHAIFSALKDKDLPGLILPLKAQVDHWYPSSLPSKRSATDCFLIKTLKNAEIFVDTCYNDPLEAFEAAKRAARIGDLILVYGSFLTVGAVMSTQRT